jgi:hypothetical protein
MSLVSGWINPFLFATVAVTPPIIPNPSFETLGPNNNSYPFTSGAMWAIEANSTGYGNTWIPGWTASGDNNTSIGYYYGLAWNGTGAFKPNPINGTYVLLIEPAASVTMTTIITNLQLNTTYTISMNIQQKGGSPLILVSVNGNTLLSNYAPTVGAWTLKTVSFNSGSSSTASFAINCTGSTGPSVVVDAITIA